MSEVNAAREARQNAGGSSGHVLEVNVAGEARQRGSSGQVSKEKVDEEAKHKVPGEIKRRQVELDLQFGQEEIMSREVELGCKSLTSFALSCSLTAVQWTLSLWLCPSMAVETAIAQCTSCCAMARRHRLNTSIVLVAVHGLSGLSGVVSMVEPSLFHPLPPLSPSLISILTYMDVKQ